MAKAITSMKISLKNRWVWLELEEKLRLPRGQYRRIGLKVSTEPAPTTETTIGIDMLTRDREIRIENPTITSTEIVEAA